MSQCPHRRRAAVVVAVVRQVEEIAQDHVEQHEEVVCVEVFCCGGRLEEEVEQLQDEELQTGFGFAV